MDIIELTDDTFAELATGAQLPLLVEFSARWCGPCRMLAPVLHDLAHEQSEQLRIAQIDVDENPETTGRYDVMSMPTLILFVDGHEEMRLVGARGKANLMQELAAHLPSRDRMRG
jgi:thioredoxin 1